MTGERRLPDRHGVWFNANGEWVAITRWSTYWHVSTSWGPASTRADTLKEAFVYRQVQPGRWKLAEPPEFEPQADPPPMVYARCVGEVHWWWLWKGKFMAPMDDERRATWAEPACLEIIPHERNDPEAIQIIEQTKEND